MPPVIEVSVSSDKTDVACVRVIEALVRAGLDARVTPNTSVHAGEVEHSCAIRIPGQKKDKQHIKQLWDVIQPVGNYECAHLRADGVFNGCILNFIHAVDVCPTSLAAKDATDGSGGSGGSAGSGGSGGVPLGQRGSGIATATTDRR